MEGNRKLRLLSYAVMVYMLLAFSWWSVLLYVKNKDAFEAKTSLLKHNNISVSSQDFYTTPEYLELSAKYKRQEWMILGEGLVFIFSLIVGVWMINGGYHKEIKLAQQKRNFLLAISHELKSPLSSIRLILETIQSRELTKEQIAKLTANGIQENDRLNSLVNNLLIATRMETNYAPFFEQFDLKSLLIGIMDHFRIIHPEFKVECHIAEDLPIVNAEKSGLVSIVNNLIENSVKYSKDDKYICLTAKQEDEYTVISVKDHGIGIPDGEKKSVFKRFYRIGNEDTRQTKGTGLGLYILNQIVLAHKGKVILKDNVPKGSIFEVYLPIKIT